MHHGFRVKPGIGTSVKKMSGEPILRLGQKAQGHTTFNLQSQLLKQIQKLQPKHKRSVLSIAIKRAHIIQTEQSVFAPTQVV